jgi:hypothetical protein
VAYRNLAELHRRQAEQQIRGLRLQRRLGDGVGYVGVDLVEG